MEITLKELVKKILVSQWRKSNKAWNGIIYGLDYIFVDGEKIMISHLIQQIGNRDNHQNKLNSNIAAIDCKLDDLFFEFQDEMNEEEAREKVIEEINQEGLIFNRAFSDYKA